MARRPKTCRRDHREHRRIGRQARRARNPPPQPGARDPDANRTGQAGNSCSWRSTIVRASASPSCIRMRARPAPCSYRPR